MRHPLELVVPRLPTGRPAIVVVDGRSGSGKTTIASRIAELWPQSTLLRLDDVYPGWDGLRPASDAVVGGVLEPLRAGGPGAVTFWDWTADAPGPVHHVAAGSRLVVEGCGALTVRAKAVADLAIWIDLDAETRKERALARDGEAYAPHWHRWAAQEDEYIAAEHPMGLADLVIDGRRVDGRRVGGPAIGGPTMAG